MNIEHRDELISAALDGERVDVDALRVALGTDEGRRSLAAFVLLRAATVADDIVPRERDDAATATVARRGGRSAATIVRAGLAASIVIAAAVASFLLGSAFRPANVALTLAAPPATVPVTSPGPVILTAPPFEIGAARGASVRTIRRTAAQPPTPTRVLRFVPGVDWISAAE